ncbi:hypothetical protein GUY44_07240 [Pimelobacter simplex]|uniref:hypothetical protein n=1 Tax=Nocardioides simplex TaxID=2045 RepID=UPI000535C509|nr:hypothetical protein [Pimelobacter simplex]MCG8150267.1 hypothetical protein [Pimelobacter simplex]SFM72301.1 hypothetical protein SAMN05421671_3148 [Pimelobacter simplex]
MGQRHVWVREKFGPRHLPGLILAWRQNQHGEWEAFVTWDNQSTADGQLETDWVPAERLKPVGDRAPSQGTAYG